MSIRKYPKNRLKEGAEFLLPQEQAPFLKNPSRSALSIEHKMFRCGIGCVEVFDALKQKGPVDPKNCEREGQDPALQGEIKNPSLTDGKQNDTELYPGGVTTTAQPITNWQPALSAKNNRPNGGTRERYRAVPRRSNDNCPADHELAAGTVGKK